MDWVPSRGTLPQLGSEACKSQALHPWISQPSDRLPEWCNFEALAGGCSPSCGPGVILPIKRSVRYLALGLRETIAIPLFSLLPKVVNSASLRCRRYVGRPNMEQPRPTSTSSEVIMCESHAYARMHHRTAHATRCHAPLRWIGGTFEARGVRKRRAHTGGREQEGAVWSRA